MSDNKNAIFAILSVDSILQTQEIRTLQAALSAEDFHANSDKYPNPDGVMGALTRTDIIDFIRDNPESLLTISPSMTQYLASKGMSDELQKIVEDNPRIQESLRAQANEILEGKNLNTLHKTDELKELQTKLALLGEYNARIDGRSGPASRNAVQSMAQAFAQAVALEIPADVKPQSRPEDLAVVAEIENANLAQGDTTPEVAEVTVEEAEVEPEPEPQNANDNVVEHYMAALGFDARGLQKGDGGEQNWSDKRDPQVWNLQVLLNRTGADILIDGDYGKGTEGTVRKFQKDHDLPVTGQADFETLKALVSLPETQFSVAGQENAMMYTIPEHHRIIEDILDDVERDTNVSAVYLRAIRGIETHFGTDMKSGTGSQGPYQFTGKTFTSIIHQYGDQIAENLKAIGKDDLADKVLHSQNGDVDRTMRYDPYIATYAAAYLTKSNGYDTTDQDKWGRAYAAHNIGLGGLNVVTTNQNSNNVGAIVDRKYPGSTPADNNPYFFRGRASGQTVLSRYQHEVEKWSERFEDRVTPVLNSLQEMENAQKILSAENIIAFAGSHAQPTNSFAGKPS